MSAIPPLRTDAGVTSERAGSGVHIAILAAGRSSRMGGANKLLAHFDGEPLLRGLATRALRAGAAGVSVVTGHQAGRVEDALAGLAAAALHNPAHASGLAGSLATAVRALPEQATGLLVMLGDMPGVTTGDLERMIGAFEANGGTFAVRATAGGRPGNPVILPRSAFVEILSLEGDAGARHILARGPVVDVELGARAALDVDTPEAMARAGGILQG